MGPIASDVRTQGLDIRSARLKAVRGRNNPDQFSTRLEHRITAGANRVPHRVKHHIAYATDDREVLGVVIDYPVSTETANVSMIVGACSRNDSCAQVLAQLHSKARNTARTALDQYGLARLSGARCR